MQCHSPTSQLWIIDAGSWLPSHTQQTDSRWWCLVPAKLPRARSRRLWNMHLIFFPPSTILVVGVSNISTHIYSYLLISTHRLGNVIQAAVFLPAAVHTRWWQGDPRTGMESPTLPSTWEIFIKYLFTHCCYSLNLDTFGFLHFWDATSTNINEKSRRYEKYFIFNISHRMSDVL